MKDEVEQALLSLNRQFYDQFARPFAESRARPQPGFYHLLEYIRPEDSSLLDVGCGEGRFGRFLSNNAPAMEYTGIDFTEKFLQYARTGHHGTYLLRDISEPDCLDGLGQFDVVACLATMQHIPGLGRRSQLLREMAAHLAESGRILLSNWQFLSSDRQRRKLVAWSEIGLTEDDVAADDYLLSWQRDGLGYRYVAHLNEVAIGEMASIAGLRIIDHFRSDGREGDLNLYTVLG
ncbi:MAG TPA: class I SAM-dependent methyltransferase [Patescibacteria group bacterium]|jgi:2-polyprenyl-3-methyl-5-hydroxy-6-metoxy-1,4-benzoquinol methylase|nr:class I SAM-dependent methyltransferase [Patescibacteria group bacterium]